MTVNTTEDTPQIEVATVIQAIQAEANRQLQEAVTGLLQKLITLSLDNQTLGKVQNVYLNGQYRKKEQTKYISLFISSNFIPNW